ncbi:MAG: hypothetical protein DRH37_02830 [Deltaproteobacteria bacterium]|nr:MAG: hypothetical protein DRH37_02830 [Deltaproteobacteria bacterium]
MSHINPNAAIKAAVFENRKGKNGSGAGVSTGGEIHFTNLWTPDPWMVFNPVPVPVARERFPDARSILCRSCLKTFPGS